MPHPNMRLRKKFEFLSTAFTEDPGDGHYRTESRKHHAIAALQGTCYSPPTNQPHSLTCDPSGIVPREMPKTPRSSTSQGKMRISIVGAGRMGTALGAALRHEGYVIQAVITRKASHARRSAKVIGGPIPLTVGQLMGAPRTAPARVSESDLVLISTPDDALESVATNLRTVFRAPSGKGKAFKRIALHTSGAVSSHVLAPLRSAGFAVGSMHPLVSVAQGPTSASLFQGVHFCVEGDSRAVMAARELIRNLRGHAFTIDPALKPLYHAAAAMASGQFLALIDVAMEMLAECGLSRKRAQRILLPLLRSSVENLETKTLAEALTGPLSRRDVATVRKHLAIMKAKKLSEAARLYSELGSRALKLSRSSAPDDAADVIAKLLRRPPRNFS